VPVSDPIIYSVVNADYVLLAKEWARRVTAVSGKQVTFACADRDSLLDLQSLGYACMDFSGLDSLAAASYGSLAFPSQHAAYTSSLKFRAALSFLQAGKDCIYSDVDAFWIRDPLPYLQASFSLAFQAGSFPPVAKEVWGFAACAGFMMFRLGRDVESFVGKVIERLDGSDQLALNQVMLDECAVQWQRLPSGWEHCDPGRGWVDPIIGKCSLSGLVFYALPHVYFQRHNVTHESAEAAVVCHPNSPKNQGQKIEVFRRLGLWGD